MPALITPEQAAEQMLRGWEAGHFEIHFPKRFTLWMKALRHLSDSLYFIAVRRSTGHERAPRRCARARAWSSSSRPARRGPGATGATSTRRTRSSRIRSTRYTAWPQIQRIFAHMFRSLERPRFVMRDIVAQGDQCFLSWDFVFR